jgi:signal transduction histidine kinase/CheY-like chemotaxis protein
MRLMQTISLTLKLELTLVVITALLIWRMWRVYPGQALRDLAMGWSLWGVRFLLSIVGTMAVTVGAAAHMPARRLLTAAAMGVSFASAIYMYGGVLQVAGIRGSVEPLRRSVVRAVPWLVLVALITTYEGVPDWWRLTMLLVSSTLVYVVTFGVLSWTLLRRPKDELTTGRQLAAFGFALYAARQVYNMFAFVSAGAPNGPPAVYEETIAHVFVSMGTIALLLERERQRGIEAVHERRRLEAELAARDHLDSIGRLAGGVAHDFNNMLTAILGNAQLGRMRLADGETCDEELGEIESTATRASALTKQLLTFARRERVRPVRLDLAARVRAMQRHLLRQIAPQARITFDIGNDVPLALADPDRVEQALVNLVVNASDALPDGNGEIVVRVSSAPGALRGADAVRLVVQDNGAGMDAAVQSRLFEPFFTTKGMERGTGLGLSIVHGAVLQANGDIRVESAPGQGARFEMLLPVATGVTAAVPAASLTIATSEFRNMLALVVDDDTLVRRVAVRLLQKMGFRVLESGDAEEALRTHAAQHEVPIKLLLTDIVMPGDNGRTLARSLCARDAQLAVVYMSGYEADAFADDADETGAPFVAKPFTEAQLTAAVKRALTTATPSP